MNVIATAANAFFFRKITQFIYSFEKTKEYEQSELICYDLGFSDEQLRYLEKRCQEIPNLFVRKFPFEEYPDFVKIHLEYYAWKPIVIDKILSERRGNLLWLDSATILFDKLTYVWRQLDEYGFYTPLGGSGILEEWAKRETLDFMKVSNEIRKKRNVCGCMIGVSSLNPYALGLVTRWRDLCLDLECLAPVGADRTNHKFDQPIVTALLYQYQEKYKIHLTQDEVNISSPNPIKFLSVRNKIPEGIPNFLNPLTIYYYKLYWRIDNLVNKIKS